MGCQSQKRSDRSLWVVLTIQFLFISATVATQQPKFHAGLSRTCPDERPYRFTLSTAATTNSSPTTTTTTTTTISTHQPFAVSDSPPTVVINVLSSPHATLLSPCLGCDELRGIMRANSDLAAQGEALSPPAHEKGYTGFGTYSDFDSAGTLPQSYTHLYRLYIARLALAQIRDGTVGSSEKEPGLTAVIATKDVPISVLTPSAGALREAIRAVADDPVTLSTGSSIHGSGSGPGLTISSDESQPRDNTTRIGQDKDAVAAVVRWVLGKTELRLMGGSGSGSAMSLSTTTTTPATTTTPEYATNNILECTTDSDCALVWQNTGCFGLCNLAVASKYAPVYEKAIRALSDGICSQYTAKCPLMMPMCMRQKAVCSKPSSSSSFSIFTQPATKGICKAVADDDPPASATPQPSGPPAHPAPPSPPPPAPAPGTLEALPNPVSLDGPFPPTRPATPLKKFMPESIFTTIWNIFRR